MGTISKVFKSLKPHSECFPPKSISSPQTSKLKPQQSEFPEPRKNQWSVYLILSTNPPIKTYVGVTNNFPRRLKQHNGELKGGAKASRAGRPWVCACLVNGFHDKSEEKASAILMVMEPWDPLTFSALVDLNFNGNKLQGNHPAEAKLVIQTKK